MKRTHKQWDDAWNAAWNTAYDTWAIWGLTWVDAYCHPWLLSRGTAWHAIRSAAHNTAFNFVQRCPAYRPECCI